MNNNLKIVILTEYSATRTTKKTIFYGTEEGRIKTNLRLRSIIWTIKFVKYSKNLNNIINYLDGKIIEQGTFKELLKKEKFAILIKDGELTKTNLKKVEKDAEIERNLFLENQQHLHLKINDADSDENTEGKVNSLCQKL